MKKEKGSVIENQSEAGDHVGDVADDLCERSW